MSATRSSAFRLIASRSVGETTVHIQRQELHGRACHGKVLTEITPESLDIFRLTEAAPWDGEPCGLITVHGMLNSRTLSEQGFRDPFEVLLAVRFEGTDNGVRVSHVVCRNVDKIGGPERVFDIHDPQVLVDAAQSLSAQPAQAGDQQADEQLRGARAK